MSVGEGVVRAAPASTQLTINSIHSPYHTLTTHSLSPLQIGGAKQVHESSGFPPAQVVACVSYCGTGMLWLCLVPPTVGCCRGSHPLRHPRLRCQQKYLKETDSLSRSLPSGYGLVCPKLKHTIELSTVLLLPAC